jgi:drug/metabolite transporter (DMT)-like permease
MRVRSAEERHRLMVGYSLALASVVLAAAGQVFMKAGVGHSAPAGVSDTLLAAAANPYVLAGLGLYAGSSAIWLVVLSRMDLSSVYPLGAITYVLVVVASWLMGEQVTSARWLGVALIVAGIVLVSGVIGAPGRGGTGPDDA